MPADKTVFQRTSRALCIGLVMTLSGLALTPGEAKAQQVVNVSLDLAQLLNRLTQPVGGTVTVPILNNVVGDLLAPAGLLSQLEDAVNAQGTQLGVQVGQLANVQVGLNGLRASVDIASSDTARRLNQLESGHINQQSRLDGHDVDISELRTASDDQSIWNHDMADTVQEHDVRVTRLESTAASNLEAIKTNTKAMTAMTVQSTARMDALGARVDSTQVLQQQQGKAIEALSNKVVALDERIDTANEGVAMALAMKSPAVADDKTFALSGGWGTFEGENAFAVSGAVRASDHLQIDAGLAVGAGEGSVGGRAGATLSW